MQSQAAGDSAWSVLRQLRLVSVVAYSQLAVHWAGSGQAWMALFYSVLFCSAGMQQELGVNVRACLQCAGMQQQQQQLGARTKPVLNKTQQGETLVAEAWVGCGIGSLPPCVLLPHLTELMCFGS